MLAQNGGAAVGVDMGLMHLTVHAERRTERATQTLTALVAKGIYGVKGNGYGASNQSLLHGYADKVPEPPSFPLSLSTYRWREGRVECLDTFGTNTAGSPMQSIFSHLKIADILK